MATEALRKCLWDERGNRLLPREAALVKAIESCTGDELWRMCELIAPSPVYLLPTVEWVGHLHKLLVKLKAKRVLEVGAGDGFLTSALQTLKPKYWLHSTDSGSWRSPLERMSVADRREFKGVKVPGLRLGEHVEQLNGRVAVERYKPDVVLCSWAPPGPLVERVIKLGVPHVIDISVEGDVCGMGSATWRFEKDFLDGPLETRALCRLDEQPRKQRHTRVTHYHDN